MVKGAGPQVSERLGKLDGYRYNIHIMSLITFSHELYTLNIHYLDRSKHLKSITKCTPSK